MIALVALTACVGQTQQAVPANDAVHEQPDLHDQDAELPPLQPADLADGDLLNVVATSNIVADIVANVGGEFIQLTDLLPTGADPHSYEAKPSDLRALHDADVVFINGLGLEGTMASVLGNPEDSGRSSPSMSMLTPSTTQMDMALKMSRPKFMKRIMTGVDPHTWMDVSNVVRWTETIASGWANWIRAIGPTIWKMRNTCTPTWPRWMPKSVRRQASFLPMDASS